MTRTKELSVMDKWFILENLGVSEQTLQIVTDINGLNDHTMSDILYSFLGDTDFDYYEDYL